MSPAPRLALAAVAAAGAAAAAAAAAETPASQIATSLGTDNPCSAALTLSADGLLSVANAAPVFGMEIGLMRPPAKTLGDTPDVGVQAVQVERLDEITGTVQSRVTGGPRGPRCPSRGTHRCCTRPSARVGRASRQHPPRRRR